MNDPAFLTTIGILLGTVIVVLLFTKNSPNDGDELARKYYQLALRERMAKPNGIKN